MSPAAQPVQIRLQFGRYPDIGEVCMMMRFIHRNMALVAAPIMTAIAIISYNLLNLLVRHHHTAMHDINHVFEAVILFGSFYAVIRYMQALSDDDD